MNSHHFHFASRVASLVPPSLHQTWTSTSLPGLGSPQSLQSCWQCLWPRAVPSKHPELSASSEHTHFSGPRGVKLHESEMPMQSWDLKPALPGSKSIALAISLGVGIRRGRKRTSRGLELASCYQMDFVLRAVGSYTGCVSWAGGWLLDPSGVGCRVETRTQGGETKGLIQSLSKEDLGPTGVGGEQEGGFPGVWF